MGQIESEPWVNYIGLNNKKGFEIVAFDNIVEWSDFTNELPLLDEKYWGRSVKPPQKDSIRIVQAHSKFNFALGDEFWTIFRPEFSSINGWEESPQEIDISALVRCKFLSILTKNEERAWINVSVEEVIQFSDICEQITKRKGLVSARDFGVFRHHSSFIYHGWTLYEAGAEGDIGIWALVKTVDDQNVVIAYGAWDLFSDLVYFGNVVLTQEEINDMNKLFS